MAQIHMVNFLELCDWIDINGKVEFYHKLDGKDLADTSILTQAKSAPLKMTFVALDMMATRCYGKEDEIKYLLGNDEFEQLMACKELTKFSENAIIVALYILKYR